MSLRTSYKLLKNINKGIDEINSQIKETKISMYFSIYGNETEREEELNVLKSYLKDKLNEKHTALENLKIEVNKELNYTSQAQKENLKVA